MKKTYETPSIEKIAFQYRDQVVVASGRKCQASGSWINEVGTCTESDSDYNQNNE